MTTKGISLARDLTGLTFNRLTVIARAPNRGNGRAYWHCRCTCDQERIVSSSDLSTGHTKSCGCWNVEVAIKKATHHGHGHKHKSRRSKTYLAWLNMRRRCENPSARGYENYGGRGIKVCARWLHFEVFLSDMGESPECMSLERTNVNGHYEPRNCVWATTEAQVNNKRTTVYVTLDGIRMSLSQASTALNCSPGRVRWAFQRYGDGWLEFVRAAASLAQTLPKTGEKL